jgi:hypothetical protein
MLVEKRSLADPTVARNLLRGHRESRAVEIGATFLPHLIASPAKLLAYRFVLFVEPIQSALPIKRPQNAGRR